MTGAGPEFTGDFELINQAGMHARPAAKVAGGLSSMNAEVTINGVDGASMTALMTLAAGKGSLLHVEAWGPDAERALNYVGGLVQAVSASRRAQAGPSSWRRQRSRMGCVPSARYVPAPIRRKPPTPTTMSCVLTPVISTISPIRQSTNPK